MPDKNKQNPLIIKLSGKNVKPKEGLNKKVAPINFKIVNIER